MAAEKAALGLQRKKPSWRATKPVNRVLTKRRLAWNGIIIARGKSRARIAGYFPAWLGIARQVARDPRVSLRGRFVAAFKRKGGHPP